MAMSLWLPLFLAHPVYTRVCAIFEKFVQSMNIVSVPVL